MTEALVLGATGYIGGHVALAAARRGWRVRALRRRAGAVGLLAHAAVEWFDGDLDRPETLMPLFEGAEVVLHAAGYYPNRSGRVQAQVEKALRQMRGVLDAARETRVGRLVYTSSLTTIGLPPSGEDRLADERDVYLPGTLGRSAYYECKSAMEREALKAAGTGPAVIVLNPTMVLGPGDLHGTLAGLFRAVARGWAIAWPPGVTNVIDVRDVAEAHVRAAEVGKPGERTILGVHNLSLHELLAQVARVVGKPPPRFEVPRAAIEWAIRLGNVIPALGVAANHLRGMEHWQAYNCAKAQRELGLVGRPLEATLRDTWDWCRGNARLPDVGTMV